MHRTCLSFIPSASKWLEFELHCVNTENLILGDLPIVNLNRILYTSSSNSNKERDMEMTEIRKVDIMLCLKAQFFCLPLLIPQKEIQSTEKENTIESSTIFNKYIDSSLLYCIIYKYNGIQKPNNLLSSFFLLFALTIVLCKGSTVYTKKLLWFPFSIY